MAEFSAGLQTRQEERYVILLFLLLLGGGGGGEFYEFFMTIGLAIPPLTVKNRGDTLIWDRALNIRQIRYIIRYISTSHCSPFILSVCKQGTEVE